MDIHFLRHLLDDPDNCARVTKSLEAALLRNTELHHSFNWIPTSRIKHPDRNIAMGLVVISETKDAERQRDYWYDYGRDEGFCYQFGFSAKMLNPEGDKSGVDGIASLILDPERKGHIVFKWSWSELICGSGFSIVHLERFVESIRTTENHLRSLADFNPLDIFTNQEMNQWLLKVEQGDTGSNAAPPEIEKDN